MKKVYHSPEMHQVNLFPNHEVNLAEVSDEELLQVLKSNGYFENKVCYQANNDYITRNIGEEVLLIPTGKQAQQLNGFISFSETGKFLWEQLSKRRTKADLIYLLACECSVDEDAVKSDVEEFLEKAVTRGLVIRQEVDKSIHN